MLLGIEKALTLLSKLPNTQERPVQVGVGGVAMLVCLERRFPSCVPQDRSKPTLPLRTEGVFDWRGGKSTREGEPRGTHTQKSACLGSVVISIQQVITLTTRE